MTVEHVAAPVRVSVAQMPVTLGDVGTNTSTVLGLMRIAADAGSKLVVFPECALTGYLFESRAEVADAAINDAHSSFQLIEEACRSLDIHVVVGLLEESEGRLFNSAMVIGPPGLLGRYRKQHLPFLGADRFVDAGSDDFPRVIETAVARIGVMICFDLRFPESARELALQGADIIAMPTNWPLEAVFLAEHMTRVRAVENLVYLAVSDRSDAESGTQFLGNSQIVAPTGDVLLNAGQSEGVFTCLIDLSLARAKRLVITPGVFELPVFEGRRPELYQELTRPANALTANH